MSEPTQTTTLRRLCRVLVEQCEGKLSDALLLQRFAVTRDEAAFEALVRRHGGMVLGVCRRALGDHHDAEDAAQATFLALARQAGSITRHSSLAGWLHRVAHRTAVRARRRARRHGCDPGRLDSLPAPAEPDLVASREQWHLLDQELRRLPEKYRHPLLLSYLEGLTNEEVARHLGWPVGTVFTRLARGRALLRSRLARRGVTLSAGALPAPVIPAGLVTKTTRASLALVTGSSGPDSAGVSALSEGVLRMTTLSRVGLVASVGLLFATVVTVALAVGSPKSALAPAPLRAFAAAPPHPRTDLYGDPLPDGAVVRLGSVQFRHARLSAWVCLPDGRTVVTAGKDQILRFWDLTTGRQIREQKLHGCVNPWEIVSLSPTGRTVVAFDEKKLLFWDTDSGKELVSLPAPEFGVRFLHFSPDGKTLAVASGTSQITLWEWQTGKKRELPQRKYIEREGPDQNSFSPDGRYLATGGRPFPLCVFEVATLREVHRFDCHASGWRFSPDSRQLLVADTRNDKGGGETVLRLIDLATGKEVKQFPQGPGVPRADSLAFSPDGKTLAVTFADGRGVIDYRNTDQTVLLDAATGRVLHRLSGQPVSLSFSRDGRTLIGRTDHRLRFWEAASGKERDDRPGELSDDLTTALSPDGRLLATVGFRDRFVCLWDTRSGRLVHEFPLEGVRRFVSSLSFTADGRTLLAGQVSGFLHLWDVVHLEKVRTVQLAANPLRKGDDVFIARVHCSPDGKRVSTWEEIRSQGEESTRLTIREIATGRLICQHRLPVMVHRVWGAGGKAVAGTSSPEMALTVTEVETGKVRFQTRDAAPFGVAASPDFRLVAAQRNTARGDWSKPAEVVVWEAASGREIGSLPAMWLPHLALSADNRTLVTTDKGHLRVHDLATGKERRRWALPLAISDHWGKTLVRRLQLLPDGRRALTVLSDGTGLIWDLTPAFESARPRPEAAGKKELAAWWADLAGDDAAKAWAALWRLQEQPEEKVLPWLREHIRPVKALEWKALQKPLAELDSETFAVREKAFEQLANLGSAAVPALRQALEKRPSLEDRLRLNRLLERASGVPPSPELLRYLRAVQILERLASKESRRLLAELAGGADQVPETEEARAALERLSAGGLGR
jgi:RNA polymerase sigma factor (sigma-70 family)